MSLDPSVTNVAIFAAHDQVDVAALEADGLFYRCFVWLNRSTWAVEACCYRLLPSGGETVVFHNVIAQATAQEVADASEIPLDSPKIIAVGTTFVAHWMQADDLVDLPPVVRNWALHRATMDMTSFSSTTWNDRGQISLLETHMLYDVCPVIGSDTDFVVARYTDASETTVQRFDGFDWIDTVWTTQGTTALAPHVLAVYAHDTDNDVVWTFENGTAGRLQSVRCDADDGSNLSAVAETMTEFSDIAGENQASWVQVGHCRVAAHRVAVVAEALASSNAGQGTTLPGRGWIHHLVYRTINSTTATQVSNIHWAAHLHMCSRPFAYAAGSTVTNPTPAVYVLASYRSCVDVDPAATGVEGSGGSAWMQSYQYGLNLDYHLWDSVSDGAGLRPRVVDTMYTVGVPDGRASGWHPEGTEAIEQDVHVGGPTKRMNHISYASAAPTFGPDVKTRTIGTVLWSKLGDISDNGVSAKAPERADASAAVLYLEDPQTIYRDSTDPDQPVDNFAVPYPRAMCQNVEIGRALVSGGGTLYSYDGQRNVELGFPYYPEIIDYFDADASGSQTHELTSGVHQWYAIYTWRDNAGQLHRSRPSNVVSIDITAGDDRIALFRVRTMTISLKDATAHYPIAPDINIELYRTAAGQIDFFRVFGSDELEGANVQSYRPRDTPANDPTDLTGTVLIYDGLSDARLILQGSAPFIYDADGLFVEPLPITWPACSVIAKFQNRLWGADSLDPSVIWYSDEILPEPGGEFYTVPELGANQFFRIGDLDSEITAMKAMDNRLIVFTRASIYALTVQDAGGGLLIVQAQPLHEGLGCISPRSVVSYPLGLMFQSSKGYYGLDRSGEATYGVLARSRDQPQSTAGASFEDDVSDAGLVMAASHDPSRHRVAIAVNGRPAVTQTWTLQVFSDDTGGAWTISGLSQPISVDVDPEEESANITAALESAVQALIDADAPDTLQFEVASVDSSGSEVTIVLLPDVDLTLTGDGPGTSTISASVEEAIRTRPRVIDYFYDVQHAARAELVQTSATTRLSEIVGGTFWPGDTGWRHVALAQGAVLIERGEDEALAFADQTASGNVGIPLDLTTSWIHLAGIAGYMRVRSMGVITERNENGAMHVDLEFDRDGSLRGQVIQPQTLDWTSPAPAYLRVRPREQKVSSVRMRIYEDSGVTTAGSTVSVVGLVFDVGVLPGMRRVADAQVGS